MNPYQAPDPAEPADTGAHAADAGETGAHAAGLPLFTVENDPLVNDSRLRLSGWLAKAGGVLRRGLGPLLVIFALTHLVPGVLLGGLSAGGVYGLLRFSWTSFVGTEVAAGGVALVLVLIVAVLFLQMLGYAAATYLATMQAAGYRVGIGAALRYGLRRCLGLTGWMMLTALLAGGALVLVGLCGMNSVSAFNLLVIVPLAAYVAAATAMVGPAYLFERGNPIMRSLHLLHGAFGRMLGRLILIWLLFVVGGVVDRVLSLAATAVPLEVLPAVLSGLVQLPLTVLVFSGILVTYAERRGDEGYTTTDLIRQL